MCQSDAAKAAGLTVGAVTTRRKSGWPEKMLLAPKGSRVCSHCDAGLRAVAGLKINKKAKK